MNRTLRIIRSAVVLTLFAAIIAGSALAEPMQAKEGGAGEDKGNLSRMADHIEIMRVLVTKAINEGPFAKRYIAAVDTARQQMKQELAEQLKNEKAGANAEAKALRYYSALAGNSYNWSFSENERPTFTSHTRGFYAKGIGVLFTTEVSTPGRLVERQESPTEAQAKAPDDDAWEEAKREVQGRGANPFVRELQLQQGRADGKFWEIDPEYVDAAINGVIEAVAAHGSRIVDLPDGESIIIAMRFEGDRAGYSNVLPVAMARAADMAVIEREAAVAMAEAPAPPDQPDMPAALAPSAPSAFTYWSHDWGASWRNKQLQVVIQVPKSAVAQFGSGALSLDGVRQQATITRYATGGADDEEFTFRGLAR